MAKVSCRKRADSWSYRFVIDAPGGKRKEVTKSGFKTKKDAYASGIKAMEAYNVTGKVEKVSTKFYTDLLDEWLESVKLDIKESTYDTYKNNIDNLIKPHVGAVQLSQLDTPVLQQCLNDLFMKRYARSRLVAIKGNMTSSLRYAKRMGYISSNPALELNAPGKTENARDNVKSREHKREIVTPEVWEAIIKRFPEGTPCYIPLVLAYRCGLRRGEAFGLTWDNVDFNASTITVDHQVQRSKGHKKFRITRTKYNSIRTIDVDKDTMDLLKRTRAKQLRDRNEYGEFYVHQYVDDNGIINTDGHGKPIMFVNTEPCGKYINHFKLAYVLLVIKGKDRHHSPVISENFDFHSLRHTHTTMLLEAGLDIKYVSERLGHKDIQVTLNIYTHLTDKLRATNKDKLDKLYQSAASAHS